MTPVKDVRDKDVVTIEGLDGNGKLHPCRRRSWSPMPSSAILHAGMIMNAYALLRKNPHPSPADIVLEMEGNLCRCGAHKRIIQAIQKAAVEIGGGS